MRRRRFLGLASGLGAAAGLGGLAGCGRPPTAQTMGPPAPAPTYKALADLPEPDIAGSADGVIPNTYFGYPKKPLVAVQGTPGDGDPVSVLTQTFSPVPPAADRNSVWSNLNAEVGSELKIQLVPQADYATKFATSVAGGALPDLFFADPAFPRMPELLAARAADLSDHLGGDAILDYPNLANIPTACWDVGRFNGRLYGLPSPRGATSSGVLFRRDDLLRARGITGEPGSFAEFADLCREVTDTRNSVWALTAAPLQYIRNMLGVPNFWRFDGTTMQSWWTVPEQEQALESARSLFAAGLVNPDAYSSPNKKTWFGTGKAYFTDDSFSSWPQFYASYGADGGFDLGACTIPAFDGQGKGALWLSFPAYGFAGVAKSAADRVPALLRVADYLAAPFGTTEYLTVRYGVEGPDYAMVDGSPQATKAGTAGSALGLKYVIDAPAVNFVPGHPEAARKMDALLRKLLPDALANDAVYLYSKTAADRFARTLTRLSNLEFEIIQGRKPVSEWRAEVDPWWKRYGAQMADELTQAYHAAGRG